MDPEYEASRAADRAAGVPHGIYGPAEIALIRRRAEELGAALDEVTEQTDRRPPDGRSRAALDARSHDPSGPET